jgi:hypothetical protein
VETALPIWQTRHLRALRARPSLFVLKLLHKLDRLTTAMSTVLGVFPPVGASPGALNSYAESINDLGQVVGSSSQEPFDVTDPSDRSVLMDSPRSIRLQKLEVQYP